MNLGGGRVALVECVPFVLVSI
uniref:Uncharacterized protein n=1 Tax=Anguilla anguilla TaxID=7936 RepID=A0A0E9VZU2_ANGAN